MIRLPGSPRLLGTVIKALLVLPTLWLAATAQDKPTAATPGQPETRGYQVGREGSRSL